MALPVVLAAVGIGMQVYSQWRASQAKAEQDEDNARRAAMMASDALARGEERAGLVEMASSRRQGAQEAAYAAAGVDATSGSAARTIAATAMVGALDAEIQRHNAYREAWGYQLQQTSYSSSASREQDQSYLDLFGQVFGGVGRIAAMKEGASGKGGG